MVQYLFYSLILGFFLNEKPRQMENLVAKVAEEKKEINNIYGLNIELSRIKEPWSNEKYIRVIDSMKPSIIRYPGGTVSSFWDFENNRLFPDKSDKGDNGWVDYSNFKDNYVARQVLTKTTQINSIKDLGNAFQNGTNAPIFCLNMVTPGIDYYTQSKLISTQDKIVPGSDNKANRWWKILEDRLERNLILLKKAKELNIPIKYIELGNEYYTSQNIYFTETFPDAQSYSKAANFYAKRIKEIYPESKIAALGCLDNRFYRNMSRRLEWNRVLNENLDKKIIDAITLHAHEETSVKQYNEGRDITMAATTWTKKFEQSMQETQATFLLTNNWEIWITEFQPKFSTKFEDIKNSGPYNTTWGSSLVAVYNFIYLSKIDNVSKILFHEVKNLVGEKDFTANGSAVKNVFLAGSNKDAFSQINFYNNRSEQVDDLMGLAFRKEKEVEVLLLNLSDRNISLKLENLNYTRLIHIENYSNNLMSQNAKEATDTLNRNQDIEIKPFSVGRLQLQN